MKAIGYITVTILLMALSTLINGFVVVKLWSWFIVTTFGMSALSLPAAMGLMLTLQFLTHKRESVENEPYYKILIESAAYILTYPVLALGIGSIIKCWI